LRPASALSDSAEQKTNQKSEMTHPLCMILCIPLRFLLHC